MTKKKGKPGGLVQITPIPPLRQSLEIMMACPKFYVESIIKGNKMPGGLESARGIEIHKVLAEYSAWCAQKGVSADLSAFDRFARGVGSLASRILVGMRESYRVAYNHLFATELTMSLDENFLPTEVSELLEGTVPDSRMPAMAQGTLDALLFFRDDNKAQIDDAKSHPRPFEPSETLQAKLYALMVFMYFSWVQEVTFRLVFVRFNNLSRSVTYTRQDVPMLMEAVKSARDRQKAIHADYESGKDPEVIAGGQCIYCPLLANATCPIAKWNPQMQLTPEQRLNFNLWYSAFSKANNKAMKEYVDGTGKPITLKDFNGKAYLYGPQEINSQIYPLFKPAEDGIEIGPQGRPVMPVVDLLVDHAYAFPDDADWMGKIQISSTSITSYLKAKKRVLLDGAVEDVVDKVTKVKLQVSKPLESLPDEVTDEDEEEEF